MDHFGDTLRDPYETYDNNRSHEETSTIGSVYSNGDTVPPLNEPSSYGETEAEFLAAQHKQTPSLHFRRSSTVSNDRNSTNGLTYLDEESDPYPSRGLPAIDEKQDTPLVYNAAEMGSSGKYTDLEYAEPQGGSIEHTTEKPPLARFLDSGKYPLDQRIADKKQGIGRQRYPFVVWILTLVMTGIFVYELVVQSKAQGTPVSFKPVVNPMLGPSQSALIQLGARFPPCMKLVTGVPVTTLFACLNDTANPPDRICPLEEICGFGGFHNETPNQWFRFITPIFLHAGFVHILLNMLAQLTLSAQIEREMGSGGFLITYFAAGIFGNVLGANFALVGAPSLGASGAIFGTLAMTWVDLFSHWKYHFRPVRRLVLMTVELLLGIAIGYIPFVDNFAHLGGFLMGLLVGTTFYPVISITKRHKGIMWAFRLAALPVVVILFLLLIRNFYTSDPYAACPGCRYLSCFPTNSNNHCKGTGLTTTTTTGSTGI
jgi:membrane associated rhomboid family serine protease